MEDLKIVYLSTDELTPYSNNSKLHPVEQIEQIKKSIVDNGMNDPIGIWGDDNIVVEGHGRLIACKELGIKMVPCIRLNHLSDAQRKEYAIVHNQTTMNSGFDILALSEEIDVLPDFDFDFYGIEPLSYDDSGDDGLREYEKTPPKAFKEFGDDIKVKNVCPRCGYEWN